MKTIILAALLVAASAAQAQVYKCTEGGKIVYSQIPCQAHDTPMDLKVHQPSEADRIRAEASALQDRIGVVRMDLEREQAKREDRAADREKQASADAMKKKCDGYKSELQKLEGRKDSWATAAYRKQDYDRIAEIKNRQFSECFGQ